MVGTLAATTVLLASLLGTEFVAAASLLSFRCLPNLNIPSVQRLVE
jgi:hypothetical protein